MKLWVDFETYSDVNIKVRGGYAYCKDKSTEVICLGYAIDDEPVQVWDAKDPSGFPERIVEALKNGATVYAHNAVFDMRIWNNILCRDFPKTPWLGYLQVLDTMGLIASYAIPRGLKAAGIAMDVTMPKDRKGTTLIKKLCCPNKLGQRANILDGPYVQDFEDLFNYCKRDVEAMREIINMLPRQRMTEPEARIWRLTQRFNTVGLPVAYDEAKTISKYLDEYIKKSTNKIPRLTGGAVQTVNQVGAIRTWCLEQGYPMLNLQKATVEIAVEDKHCPSKVKSFLVLRQELGKTSTAKYKKIIDQACKGKYNSYWVHDNLIYHGASPGRWTGKGFQMHNLPRASVENPEAVIEQFMLGEEIEDPVGKGKALIRPMIKAPVDWNLIVSDYSAIENRVLHWLAGDHEELTNFSQGLDQYKTMAAARYGVPYEEVTKSQRMMGKVIILGAGYGMGAETFQKTCKVMFNMEVSEAEAKTAIAAYRDKYPGVVKLWKGLKGAAIKTVISGQRNTYGRIVFATATVNSIRWMAMRLPNGKCIYYKNPLVEQKYIPKYESMGRVPTITHDGFNSYSRKWGRMALTPGRITENADQGTSREIMAEGMLNIQDNMKAVTLIGTVHDECLGLIKIEDTHDDTLDLFNKELCTIPWADGLPLKSEGFIAKRYRKE